MKNRLFIGVLILGFMSFACFGTLTVHAEEDAAPSPTATAGAVAPATAEKAAAGAEAAKVVEKPELTQEDILERLVNIFKYNDDIRSNIAGVAAVQVESGVVFEYNGTALEELDQETLLGLLRNANGQLSMKNFQKLQRQLKNLKQLNDLNRTQRMLKQLKRQTRPAGYNPVKIYSPPKIPKPYKPPPKPYRPPRKY